MKKSANYLMSGIVLWFCTPFLGAIGIVYTGSPSPNGVWSLTDAARFIVGIQTAILAFCCFYGAIICFLASWKEAFRKGDNQ